MDVNRKRFLLVVSLFVVILFNNAPTAAKPPIREAPKVLKGAGHGIGRIIPNLEFVDLHERVGRLNQLSEKSPVVILLTGISCPLCRRYTPSLASLEKDYLGKAVRFLFINPNKAEISARLKAAVETPRFKGPYVRDDGHSIIRALGARTTTEAFVLNSQRKLVYRGAVDDQYGFGYSLNTPRRKHLRDALDAVLQGQSPNVSATSAPGCDLWFDDEESLTEPASAEN